MNPQALVSRTMPQSSSPALVSQDRLCQVLAFLLAGLFLVTALYVTHDLRPRAPDTIQYSDIARSLASGDGYTVGFIVLHPELYEHIERIPEMHGLLRPFVVAGLYRTLGVEPWVPSVPGFLYVALTSLVAFGFARTLFGPLAGLLACTFVLGSRSLWDWALFGLDDTGLAFYFLLSTWFFHLGLRREKDRWFVAAGVIAAVGLLEKLSGLILPGVFVATLATLRPWPAGTVVRRATFAVLPVLVALGLYLLRNHAAHGDWMFRFSPIEWQWKLHGHTRLTDLYVDAPSVPELFMELGPQRVFGLVATELRRLWTSATAEVPIWLGAVALVLCTVRRAFVAIVLWSLIGSAAFLCVLYHVEPRYLSMWIALLSVSAGGGVARMIEGVGRGMSRTATQWVGILVAVMIGGGTLHVLTSGIVPPLRGLLRSTAPRVCAGAIEYLEANASPGSPVLTNYPWLTRWFGGYPSVSIPGTRNRDIMTVLDHYGMEWVMVGPGGTPRWQRKLDYLFRASYGGTNVYEQKRCRVYRVGSRSRLGAPKRRRR